jgi:uncharacterized protein YjiK
MKHKKHFTALLLTAFMCFAAFAQIPTVTLTASKNSLNEGESTVITATLSTASTQDVTIDFDLSGTATDGINYYSESKVVNTVVGTGSSGSGANQLNAPYGIAFDTAGNMYVAESNNHRVQKFTKTGPGLFDLSGITVAGTGTLGSGATQLNNPKGIAFDAKGNMYVVDSNNSRVQKFKTTGTGTFNPSGVTVAGTGGLGVSSDQLKNPEGIAFDATGYMYVADYNNSRIQQFPTAVSGISGTSGTIITQIDHPRGVAFDSAGNIYVVDTYYDYIIKYAKTGTGTFSSTRITVAGTGAEGLGSTPLNDPYGIAFDASGNMYVSTKMNIQKFANKGNGNLSNIGATVAGAATLGSGATQLNTACGLTFDSSGNMYVADNKNQRIQRYLPGKLQITIPAGSTTGSLTINAFTATSTPNLVETIILTPTATNATITDANPMTITINLLPKVVVTASKTAIAEGENTLIIATLSTAGTNDVTVNFTLSGTATTADYTVVIPAKIIIPAGSTTGTLTVNTLTDLLDKEISETVIFTATVTNSTLIATNQTTITINNVPTVKVTTSKTVLNEGENTSVTATLSAACTQDVMVIFDLAGTATEDLDYYSKNKQVLTVAGTGTWGSGANQLYVPKYVTFDTAGNMYVADTYNHRIQKFAKTGAVTFNPEGTTVAGTGTPGTGSTKLSFPEEVAFDSAGNMYVADSNGARIQKFTKTGSGTFDTIGITVAGTGLAGSGSTRFNVPRGLAFDAADNLYVADSANHRIQKFANTGTGTFNPLGTTVAGTGTYGSGSTQLDNPQSVTFDSSGNMYVTDYNNDRIQKFISTGSGTFNPSGVTIAGVANPRGVTFDAKGNMYVVNQADNLILKYTKTGTGTFNPSATIMAGTVALGSLSYPEGVAFDATGNMYVVDGNHRIQQYLSSGKLQITIPAGSITASLTVNALTDTLNPEPNETVILTATAINVTIAGIDATTLTISNLPPTVGITVDKTNISEGEETTVTATLSMVSTSDITVELTLSGTTTEDDYSISTTKITIPAGHTTGTATIKTVMDSNTEEAETLIVTTASAKGATVIGLEITISIQNVINLGLESHQLLDAKIYPNPVMDLLKIDIPENYLFKSVEIFNLLGQLQGEVTQETISMGNLPTGGYILKIHTAKGVIVKKIIKK